MDIPHNLVAILVPMGVFALAAFIVGAALLARHRARELRHQTIRMALDKGQPVPPELLAEGGGRPRLPGSDLARGIKLVFTGAGISFAIYLWHRHAWPLGLIVLAVGVGYLVSHWATTRGGHATGAPPK